MTAPGQPTDDDPLVGHKLDERYLLQAVIGRGASGVVYRGLQLPLERPVAIKTLSQSLEDTLDWVRRFRREARVLSQLAHPNSVRLIDFGHTADGMVFLVMELLEGYDLFRHLQRHGALQLGAAVDIARQALGALHEAHDKGIIHRDLKPSNLFLCRTEWSAHHVKIIDYGLAKGGTTVGGDSLTGSGTLVGTPQYMAPEQCLGQKVNHATDLYAVGVILFEMLAGRPPFEGRQPMDLLSMHVNASVPHIGRLRPDLPDPDAVQNVLELLLAKRQDQRPTSAREAVGLLDRLVAGLPDGHGAAVANFGQTGAVHETTAVDRPAAVDVDEHTALAIPAMPDDDDDEPVSPPELRPEIAALSAASQELLDLGAQAAQAHHPAGLSAVLRGRTTQPRPGGLSPRALTTPVVGDIPALASLSAQRSASSPPPPGVDGPPPPVPPTPWSAEPDAPPPPVPQTPWSAEPDAPPPPVPQTPWSAEPDAPPPVPQTPWSSGAHRPPPPVPGAFSAFDPAALPSAAPPSAAPPASASPSSAPPSSAPPSSAPPASAPPSSGPPLPASPAPAAPRRRRPSRPSSAIRRRSSASHGNARSVADRRMPRRSVPVTDLWSRLRVEFRSLSDTHAADLDGYVRVTPTSPARPVTFRRDRGMWVGRVAVDRPELDGVELVLQFTAPAGTPYQLRVWTSRPSPHVVVDKRDEAQSGVTQLRVHLDGS